MKLYGYWRSSAAYRVRIALQLKGIDCQQVTVNLLKGEQGAAAYLAVNPAGLIPALELDDGRYLSQSTAIIQWLDSEHPQPPLLPDDAFDRAQVLSCVYTVACEIHPLNNIGILNYLKSELGADKAQTLAWMTAWFKRGFASLEASISAAPYCFGDRVTMADIFLVPMAYNALRFDYDLGSLHPKVMAVYEACNTLPAFGDARPENQPDAVPPSY
ncbi:MAG: maleylacetoacetate isomerase [Gammaproteobacteria bacterium]|nr:maleylacetoacetate isomerase [Gammaproteobacteria bacterium]